MGRIRITGTPGALTVTHADGRPYGAPPAAPPSASPPPKRTRADDRPHEAAPATAPHLARSIVADARSALINMGMKPGDATTAVAAAASHMERDPTLDALIRAARSAFPPR